jgi:adenine specific DNA methylase Mod
MESNKNDNNDEGDEHEQLRRNAQKRKLNELTNDEGKPAAGDEDQPGSSKKNRKEKGNDLDLEVCTYLDLKESEYHP